MTNDHLLPLPPPVFHILVALASGERHGYGIMQDVAERTSGRVKLGPGSLYGSIERDARAGPDRGSELAGRPGGG